MVMRGLDVGRMRDIGTAVIPGEMLRIAPE
jgi:hypothetical protein